MEDETWRPFSFSVRGFPRLSRKLIRSPSLGPGHSKVPDFGASLRLDSPIRLAPVDLFLVIPVRLVGEGGKIYLLN